MKLSGQQLFCRISKDLEIWADDNQYILRRGNNRNKDRFYADLEALIQDIFKLKMKEFTIKNNEKSLNDLGKAIKEAENYIHQVVRPILDGHRQQKASPIADRE